MGQTIEEAGFRIAPYHAYVPSFGEWGYFIGSFTEYQSPDEFPKNLKFISKEGLAPLFHFPRDLARIKSPTQRLNNQVLVHLFEKEWSRVN